MKIHEYQAKNILEGYGIRVPKGIPIRNGAQAWDAAETLGAPLAVKAQVHAGGRGKAGGVKIATSQAEAEEIATKMLGSTLFSPQTGPEGKLVRLLLLEEGIDIEKEFYLSLLVNREDGNVLIMAGKEGGVEIEKTASHDPTAIIREKVDSPVGPADFQSRRMASALGITSKGFSRLLDTLYRILMELDCTMIELNPLVLTGKGELVALDAKIEFDDNALYRHPEIRSLRDYDEEHPLEVKASRHHLNYIKMDGDIGCMVNGAGLAMATMDIIKLAGGNPANFLDVGGGASAEQIEEAFKILASDQRVKAVLVNIFGGIMRCDLVADGIVRAISGTNPGAPVVIRLEGTNVAEGKRILDHSGLKFIIAEDMKDAAVKVVQAASGTGG